MKQILIFLSLIVFTTCFQQQKYSPILIKDRVPNGVKKGYVDFYPADTEISRLSNAYNTTDIWMVYKYSSYIKHIITSTGEIKSQDLVNVGPRLVGNGREVRRIAGTVGKHLFVVAVNDDLKQSVLVDIIEGKVTPVKVSVSSSGGQSRTLNCEALEPVDFKGIKEFDFYPDKVYDPKDKRVKQ